MKARWAPSTPTRRAGASTASEMLAGFAGYPGQRGQPAPADRQRAGLHRADRPPAQRQAPRDLVTEVTGMGDNVIATQELYRYGAGFHARGRRARPLDEPGHPAAHAQAGESPRGPSSRPARARRPPRPTPAASGGGGADAAGARPAAGGGRCSCSWRRRCCSAAPTCRCGTARPGPSWRAGWARRAGPARRRPKGRSTPCAWRAAPTTPGAAAAAGGRQPSPRFYLLQLLLPLAGLPLAAWLLGGAFSAVAARCWPRCCRTSGSGTGPTGASAA